MWHQPEVSDTVVSTSVFPLIRDNPPPTAALLEDAAGDRCCTLACAGAVRCSTASSKTVSFSKAFICARDLLGSYPAAARALSPRDAAAPGVSHDGHGGCVRHVALLAVHGRGAAEQWYGCLSFRRAPTDCWARARRPLPSWRRVGCKWAAPQQVGSSRALYYMQHAHRHMHMPFGS